MDTHAVAPEGDLAAMLTTLVADEPGVVVFFTEGGCHVADTLEPRVEGLVRQNFPGLRFAVVSKDHAPVLAAQLNVFVFPTVVVFFGGKESARFVRRFSLDEVGAAIERPYSLLFG